MRMIKYTVYQEGKHYVSQCLNVDISSFGNSIDEAVENLVEALELYFEDDGHAADFTPVHSVMIGEREINA